MKVMGSASHPEREREPSPPRAARRARASLLGSLVLTAASALLLGLAFPPTGWRPVAWIALVPFFVVLRSNRASIVLLLTWVWTHVLCYVVWDWGPAAVTTYFQQSQTTAVALFFGLATSMMAPYFIGFAFAYRALARRFSTSLPLWTAAAWAAAELARSRLLTETSFFSGNPWALVGYSQVGFESLVQIASITGVYGISFVVVAMNAVLAEAVLIALRGQLDRSVAWSLGLALLPCVAALAFGFASLAGAGRTHTALETQIVVVQGNVGLESRWRSDLYGRNLDTYLELTEQALDRGGAEMVFWPEAAMTFFVAREPSYRSVIARSLAPRGAELLAGAPHYEGDDYFNSAFVLSARGALLGRYDKQYLVPFAEFFPLGRIDLLRRSFGRIREFSRGDSRPPLPTRAGPAGIVTCNEAWFPEVAGRRVREGAGYLVNLSNDTWFEPNFSAQSFDMVRMRAVEQRRYLVRASTSGPSAIVDPWGRVLARSEPLEEAVLRGSIRARLEPSLYGRLGDVFAGVSALVVAGGLLLRRPGRRDFAAAGSG
jgi:apolipoprotein N-acyltransferase